MANARPWDEFQPALYQLTLTLKVQFPSDLSLAGLLVTQRQDKSPNGRFRELSIHDQEGKLILRTTLPRDSRDFRLTFPKHLNTNRFTLTIESSDQGNFGCLAEIVPAFQRKPDKEQ